VSPFRALAAGAAGAAALTAAHQLGRAALADPPRMDVLGRRALRAAGVRLRGRELQRAALAGDLLANTLYYALAVSGRSRRPARRGLLFGAAAGLGGVFLPGVLGLGSRPSRRRASTAMATLAWYALGGLVAGAAARRLRRADRGGPASARDGAALGRAARWQEFAPIR
jgi:hypothetical protein